MECHTGAALLPCCDPPSIYPWKWTGCGGMGALHSSVTFLYATLACTCALGDGPAQIGPSIHLRALS